MGAAAAFLALSGTAFAQDDGSAPPPLVAFHTCDRPAGEGAVPLCVRELAARVAALNGDRRPQRRVMVATTAVKAGLVRPGRTARPRTVFLVQLVGDFDEGPSSAPFGPFREIVFAVPRSTRRAIPYASARPGDPSLTPRLERLGRPIAF